ncbi:MAG TPA: sigma-70 family RNA polymerase sigma factor [Stellaceae bacterium]|nr:sigma-70 family RNA polymerase sigma factor [Stellaceae bacterium]
MTDIKESVAAELTCLRRYARKLARDDVLAEDLLQECLVRSLTKIHLWREGTNLRAWLCTILHNQYVNEIRRMRRERNLVDLSEVDETLAYPPTQDISLELCEVSRAIQALPKGQRLAVTMIGIHGMGYDKVARIAGVPVGTVRSRLSRGRDKLRMAA